MIKKILLVLLVAGLAGGGYLYTRLDSLVKKAVENYGPRLTRTTFTLRGVHLSPFSGEGRITGLVIGSPAGFKEPELLSLGTAHMAVDPKSLLTNVIDVRVLEFEAPELHYERQSSGVNLDALQRNIESFLPASAAAAAAASKPAKPKKIRIEHFSARGGKVYANLYGVKLVLPLPDVSLDGIGGKSGIEPKDAARAVLAALTHAAVQAVAGSNAGRGVARGLQSVRSAFKSLFH